MERLRDIHKNKRRKFSRRRLLGILGAAGVTGATLTAITSEDIQAASSDQIPIALDLEGESKWNVPLDWYEQVLDAREVLEDYQENLLEDDDDILSAELNPGDLNGQNPSVIIGVDEEADNLEDPRTNISASIESSNDVEIEVEERPNPLMEAEEQEGEIGTQLINDYIDTDPCGDITTNGDIPGGLVAEVDGVRGTLTSRVSNGLTDGWVTNAHVASMGPEECGNDLIGEDVDQGGQKIGEVIIVDHDHDFVVIQATEDRDPLSEVVVPSDHSDSYEINGTMSIDGFDTFSAEEREFTKVGTTTCDSSGVARNRGRSVTVKGNDYCRTSIIGTYTEQVTWGSATNDIRPGDSGSPTFGEDPNGSGYLGVCVNISWTTSNNVHGTPGWVLKNESGYDWV